MSMRTTLANSQALRNTTFAGITPVYPFTVGGWFSPLVASVEQDIWEVDNSGNTTAYWFIYMATGNVMHIGSGAVDQACANTLSVGTWYYWVARFISATNRRITVLEPAAIENVQSVTSNTPSGFNGETLGANFDSATTIWSTAHNAEMWRTDTDIQPDGAALLTSTLIQLAYKGPWSISSVAERIVWYKSLRQSLDDISDTIDDPCFARNGRAGWNAQTASPIVGPHPPLASDYVYLNTLKQKLTV